MSLSFELALGKASVTKGSVYSEPPSMVMSFVERVLLEINVYWALESVPTSPGRLPSTLERSLSVHHLLLDKQLETRLPGTMWVTQVDLSHPTALTSLLNIQRKDSMLSFSPNFSRPEPASPCSYHQSCCLVSLDPTAFVTTLVVGMDLL